MKVKNRKQNIKQIIYTYTYMYGERDRTLSIYKTIKLLDLADPAVRVRPKLKENRYVKKNLRKKFRNMYHQINRKINI